MKKSTKPSRSVRKDSIFVQLMVSTTMSYILLVVGAFFIYFLSPEGDPLNKGENGKGSWNLWVGLLIWVVMIVLYFFKDKLSEVDFDNDPVLKKLDKEIGEINKKHIPKLKKFKKEDPENFYKLVKAGVIDLDDLKEGDESPKDKGKTKGKES